MGIPRPLFVYFATFTANPCENIFIQYTVLGFEPTTLSLYIVLVSVFQVKKFLFTFLERILLARSS